jgi:hypothetical protein
MALLSCGHINKDEITVIGKAENAKAGASIISRDDKKLYYIDGIDFWDEKTVGKMIRVSGKLRTEKTEEQNSEEDIKQQIVGIKRIIEKPHWEFF